VFIFVVYFFIDSVRKLLNIPSYIHASSGIRTNEPNVQWSKTIRALDNAATATGLEGNAQTKRV